MLLDKDAFFELEEFQFREIFEGVVYPWEVLPKISSYLRVLSLGNIEVEVPDGAFLINPDVISIGKGTVIEPGAYIAGPCVIGRDCTVRQGAYVRGNVVAGDRCVLGHASEFKNALLLNDAHAAHFAYVGDSVLGNRVNLGAGTVCANLKLKRDAVVVSFGEERYSTGLKKFGAILGDGAQTGCNSVLNPGTLLGKGATCYPCSNVRGVVLSGKCYR